LGGHNWFRHLNTQSKPQDEKTPAHDNLPEVDITENPQGRERIKRETVAALRPVHMALLCNGVICVGKFGMYTMSGSSVMFAEAVHSLADFCNQYLLRIGITKSMRAPDSQYNYGYSRDRFVWSLISAVGIFCLGAGVNIQAGVHAMMDPHSIENIMPSLAVLGASGIVDMYSFIVAHKFLKQSAEREAMGLSEYLRSGRDPSSAAILAEDGVAVLGVCVAGACLGASHMTGNAMYDGLGSVLVGGLLAAVAVQLIRLNRSQLLGRSMSPTTMHRIKTLIQDDPVVKSVHDIKTEEIGPGQFRFKAEVEFCGRMIVENYLNRRKLKGREEIYQAFRKASLAEDDNNAMQAMMLQYGEEVVEALGDEVDRLEKAIYTLEPRIIHVDIETH